MFGGAFLIAGVAAPLLIADERLATFGAATLRLGVTLVGVGVLTLVWREKPWWQVAVAGFVVLDLLFFGWPLVPTVDRALYQGSTQVAAFLEESGGARIYWPTDPTHRDREYDAENRVKFEYLRFGDFGSCDVDHWRGMREALIPNVGVLDGVASVNNFDPLLVGRYVDLLSVAKTSQVLRVMGVTYVMSDVAWPDAELAYTTDAVALYRLPDILGRAWIVPAARHIDSAEMLQALSDPAFDPAVELFVEDGASSSAHSLTRPFADSKILSLQDGPNRVTIRAALDAPGYLVLADTWYPGWRAAVDGEPVEILRANYAFRAVRLEAGEHTVEMVYRPTSVLVGGALSLVALAVIFVGLLLARKRETIA